MCIMGGFREFFGGDHENEYNMYTGDMRIDESTGEVVTPEEEERRKEEKKDRDWREQP